MSFNHKSEKRKIPLDMNIDIAKAELRFFHRRVYAQEGNRAKDTITPPERTTSY